MTAEALEHVEFWLEKRRAICASDLVSMFLADSNKDKINGANQIFERFLAEAKCERKIAAENGGYVADALPAIMISN